MNSQLNNSTSMHALIVEHTRNGEIEALKTIDFTLFTRQEILIMYHDVYQGFKYYSRVGLKFLEEILNTVYTCETKDYIVYLQPVSEVNQIHKLFNKSSNTYTTMYACDLAQILSDERLDVPYFRQVVYRSTYEDVVITPEVILDYAKNGEIELIKNIDFSLVDANNITRIYEELVTYEAKLSRPGPDGVDPIYTREMWKNLDACINFICNKKEM